MLSRILFLGNETQDTDDRVTAFAHGQKMINRGLITDPKFSPAQDGCYHTTVVDLASADIINLATKFDKIVMLDQPQQSFPHFKTFVTLFRLFITMESQGLNVDFRKNANTQVAQYWWNLLRDNKSFCMWPFLAVVDNIGSTTVCGKSLTPIKKSKDIQDWKSDPEYSEIRQNMIDGIQMSQHCADCYNSESYGTESARQFETFEWALRKGFRNTQDLNQIKDPVLYEIRPSNKCNIMCRMCDNYHSHLIEQEWKQIGIPMTNIGFQNYVSFDNINISSMERIYVAGGEPTIMPEFYDFLRKCVDRGYVNFELNIGTNGMKFSDRLIKLLDNFPDVCLSVSFDGYKKVNDYIRWKSDFDVMWQNSLMMRDRGHKIGLQTVISIYNVTRIHEIFEFYDREFPGSGLLIQPATGQGNALMPWHHPRADLVTESMRRCQQTKIYHANGRSSKSMIDALLAHYSRDDYHPDLNLLGKFFRYNDKLDLSRNSRLGDYIPELENCRSLVG